VSTLYEELVERIRGEALDLERVVQRALRAELLAFADFLEELAQVNQAKD